MPLIFGTPIYGTEGDDVIVDTAGINTIFANGGDDHITIPHAVTWGEYNVVHGGTGDDIVKVDWGDSILSIYVRQSSTGTYSTVDPIGIRQSVEYSDVEHLDFTTGSGDVMTLSARVIAGIALMAARGSIHGRIPFLI